MTTSRQLAEADFPLYSVVCTPDNRVIVGGGGGKSKTGVPNGLAVYKWEEDFPLVGKLDTEEHAVWNIALHPQEPAIVCGMDEFGRVYSFKRDTSAKEKETSEEASGDDKKATEEKEEKKKEDKKAKVDSTAPFFHLESSQVTDTAEEPWQKVCRLNADGTKILTGGQDGTVRLWKYPSFEKIAEFKGHTLEIKDVAFHPNDTQVAAVSHGKEVIVWNVKDGSVVKRLEFKYEGTVYKFNAVRYLTFDNLVYVYAIAVMPGHPSHVVAWSTRTWNRSKQEEIDPEPCTAFDVSPCESYLAVGTCLGTVKVYDAINLKCGRIAKEIHPLFVTGLAFSPDSSKLVSISADKRIVETVIDFSPRMGMVEILQMLIWVMILILAIMLAYLGPKYADQY
eukprot:comp22073_c1_seq1/m.32164 comp22073_c1_seq1/g.32164  ORF comp22073_c1_seq1/g.32164 comp22073_c1_seq1/m.32164 type:complete len:394 (-) comp22073_c1_seq1:247-1428(-)